MGRLGAAFLALLLASCSPSTLAEVAPVPPPAPTTTASAPEPTGPTETAPPTTEATVAAPAPPTAEAMAPGWTLAGRVGGGLAVRVFPGAPFVSRIIPPATILGTPTVVRVLEGPRGGWARVSLPGRPNGATGWVAASDLELFEVDRAVVVELGEFRLTVMVDGEPVLTTPVAVGSPRNPTPPGEFYVTDVVDTGNPGGPWGPHAFGLSARSDTITEFNGGDGIIAVHGTNRPASIGSAASLGCVRVPNEVSMALAELLVPGVPVTIVP
jgi:hypothetical protein